jgi:hypothetical protein
MKVEIFNLCDFASVDAGAKMNLIGVFDSVYAKETPIVQGMCALAIRIRFEKLEEGLKKLKLSFVNADGLPIMPTLETQVPISITFPGATTAIAQLVSIVTQLTFPSFGEYSVGLAIDGRQEASTPVYVRQVPSFPPHLQLPLPHTS